MSSLLLASPIAAVSDRVDPLEVVYAEAPRLIPRLVTLAAATVTVRVVIGQDGIVTSSVIEQDFPLFRRYAEAAARQWVFVPDKQSEPREALLSFVFAGVRKAQEPTHLEVSFEDPLTMRIVYVESTVSWLPREGGTIPEQRCPVHGEAMTTDLVPIRYGLPSGYVIDGSLEERRREAAREAYWEAQQKLFPESNWSARAGCLVRRETKAEVYYCPLCRRAEVEWLMSHPEQGEYATH